SPVISNGNITRVGLVLAVPPRSDLTGHVFYKTADGVSHDLQGATVVAAGVTAYSFRTLPSAPFFTFDVVSGNASANTGTDGTFTVATSTTFKFATGRSEERRVGKECRRRV